MGNINTKHKKVMKAVEEYHFKIFSEKGGFFNYMEREIRKNKANLLLNNKGRNNTDYFIKKYLKNNKVNENAFLLYKQYWDKYNKMKNV